MRDGLDNGMREGKVWHPFVEGHLLRKSPHKTRAIDAVHQNAAGDALRPTCETAANKERSRSIYRAKESTANQRCGSCASNETESLSPPRGQTKAIRPFSPRCSATKTVKKSQDRDQGH